MSTPTVALRLASALGLVFLNGYFVAVEFAIVATRTARIDCLVAEGNATAKVARRLMGNPDRVIAASQLGITMASLALGWIGEATVAAIIEPLLIDLVGGWSEAIAHSVGIALAFALVTFTHIVIGEQVPKTIAIRYAERSMLAVCRIMDGFIRVFRPFIAFLDGSTAVVLRLLHMEPIAGHRTVYTLDELRLLVRESQEGGALELRQGKMLQNVFLFGDRQVREVMIPRPDIVGVEVHATMQELLELFAEASHARFPVFEGDLDNIVGIIAIKDVLRALAQDSQGSDETVRRLARPADFVPETVAVSDLLAQMRASQNQMAVIIDEYGGTSGIVTLEELVEEIVGRLSDELATVEEPVIQMADGTIEVQAQLRVDELNDRLDLSLPEGEDYETVAGFLLFQMQRVPVIGETLCYRDLELTITSMKGPKIEKLRIERRNPGVAPSATEKGG
jgi:CBS domain containing-hemolysin-like protein